MADRVIPYMLYMATGSKGDEKPEGSCLGFIPFYPNRLVQDQTGDILKAINRSLALSPDPVHYDHAKFIRKYEKTLVYDLIAQVQTNPIIQRFILLAP